MENGNLKKWKLGKMEICKMEIWKIGNLEKWKFEKMEIWKN